MKTRVRSVKSAAGRRLASWVTLPLVAVTALFAVMAWVPTAEAIPPILKPNSHQMFAQFNFGPAIGIDPSVTHFKIAQEFGYHLNGGGDGPAIGASIEEAFGNGNFRLQIGPKFWWDFQLVEGLGLYLGPTGKIGYSLWTYGSGSNHYVNLQMGLESRLVLGDKGFVMFRPITLDMGIGGGDVNKTFVIAYDMMFGGGFVF